MEGFSDPFEVTRWSMFPFLLLNLILLFRVPPRKSEDSPSVLSVLFRRGVLVTLHFPNGEKALSPGSMRVCRLGASTLGNCVGWFLPSPRVGERDKG